MSFRRFVSIFSLVLVIALIVLTWKDIRRAWVLLGQVDLWILFLIIPAQLLSYYASGAIITSFLKAKGNLQNVKHREIIRFALEFNFVNHILPTGGLSGLSYATWRFKKLGVNPSRTALANVLRAALVFLVLVGFLFLSIYILALQGNVDRIMLVSASSLTTLIIVGVLLTAYIINTPRRARLAGSQIAGWVNAFGREFLRRKQLIKPEKAEDFFLEIHEDYKEIRHSPRQLKASTMWSAAFVIFEISMFFIVFASFGYFINPAALLIAYGVAGAAGILAATPGGAGAYEVAMVAVLAGAGVDKSAAIAAVVLARVVLILLTLVSGYVFYQLALIRYGKKRTVQPE